MSELKHINVGIPGPRGPVGPPETATSIGSLINSSTEKTAPVNADHIGLMDSEDGNIMKKVSWDAVKQSVQTSLGTLTKTQIDQLGTIEYLTGSDGMDYAPPNLALPPRLVRMVRENTWLYRSLATGSQNNGGFFVYVSMGGGKYSGFLFGRNFSATAVEMCLGRVYAGIIGSYKHHTGATKTGSWTTSSLTYAADGSCSYSTTAGDSITFANVKGHTLVARTIQLTNGGMYIVSVDGSYTAATRLPVFTENDFSNARCRSSDVGKRYIDTYQSAAVGDYHVPLAEGLADVNHTVVFEATGTKSAASGGARSYISGVVGCSNDDVGQTVSDARVIAHVESLFEAPTGASAWANVAAFETSTPGVFELLGNIHPGGTEVSAVVKLDNSDLSSMTAGTWQAGQQVSIEVTTTLANTAAPGTVIATKTTLFVLSSYLYTQLLIEHKTTFSVSKRLAPNYVMMLPICSFNMEASNALGASRWNMCQFGNYTSSPGHMNSFDGSNRGKCAADLARVYSSVHDYTLYGVLLDGLSSVNGFLRGADTPVFLSDRVDKTVKIYFCRSNPWMPETFQVGQTVTGLIGYGIIHGAS